MTKLKKFFCTGMLALCCQQALADEDAENALLDKYRAGKYWTVGSEGESYLEEESANEDLRLAVANSLAWTGRYQRAINQYQAISRDDLYDAATLGIANVYRWQGRPDLALPLYQQLLAANPASTDALEGLTRVERELRPKTKFTLGSIKDTSSVAQYGGTMSHSWRGDDLALSYELSVSGFRQTQNPLAANQGELGFAAEHDGMMFSPRIEVSLQQLPASKAFAQVKLKLDSSPIDHVTVGYVNWGKMAFTPLALTSGLGAMHFGFDASMFTQPGRFTAAYDIYGISDGNQIQDANFRFYPSWPPLGGNFRYFAGLSGRDAARNDPRYWSPPTGYLSADLGLMTEWTSLDWDLSAYGQRGFRAGGEAQKSYAGGFSAKRHIGQDWAAMVRADYLSNMRVGAYRSRSVSAGIEKLW